MATEKLYYQDAHQAQFQATVCLLYTSHQNPSGTVHGDEIC